MNVARLSVCVLATACLSYGYQAPQAAPNGQPATASIEGQVFNLATGAPLKKTTVRLTGLGPLPQGAMPTRLSKETDEQGRFSFTALDAGRYQITAERLGFLHQNYGGRKYSTGGTPLAISPDQHVRDIVFRLSPQSVITGKVLDDDGDPVANVQVRAMKYQYRGDKKQWTQVGAGQTSDIGEYRIPNLDPGRYLVSTTARNGPNILQTVSNEPLPKTADMAYGSTYYPSTLDSASGVTVDVGAAGEIHGIDIRLRKTPVFRIRGKVTNAPIDGRGSFMVIVMPKDGMPGPPATSQARPPEYRFEIHGVSPGSYVVHTQVGNGEQQLIGFQEVQLGNQHIDGLILTLGRGEDVQGSVKVEDATSAIPMPSLSAFLQPSTPIGNSFRGKVGDDSKFTVKNVLPLHYTVRVGGVPDTCYVKSIVYGGQPVPDDGVDILGSGVIEVTLSATAGQIDAAIVDKDGKPVAGALVALYPKGGKPSDNNSRQTNETGAVSFKGLKPGDYRVIAWEDIPWGASQDPDFVKPFEGRGETVKLDASGHQAVQVKVIPAAETDK